MVVYWLSEAMESVMGLGNCAQPTDSKKKALSWASAMGKQ